MKIFLIEHLFNLKMPRSKEQFQEMREKTRENILSTALRLFAEKGFNGTSINDIAKAASISKVWHIIILRVNRKY